MTHNLSFRYYADMTTKGLGLVLGSAKVEVKSNQIFIKPKIRGPRRAYKYNTKKINTHTHTFRLYNDL